MWIHFGFCKNKKNKKTESHFQNYKPFALITATTQGFTEAISLWHCLGIMEAQISLMFAVSTSLLLCLVPLMFLLDPWVPNERPALLSSGRKDLGPLADSLNFLLLGQIETLLTLAQAEDWVWPEKPDSRSPFPEWVWIWWFFQAVIPASFHSFWTSARSIMGW